MAQGSRGGKRCSNKEQISTWALSLLGSTPKKVFQIKYFFCILRSEVVTKISTLYKVSSLKLILIFESNRAIATSETRR